jgi:hypothetical protein
MRKQLVFAALMILFISHCYGQENLRGKVMEYGPNTEVSGIRVENLNSHIETVTDNKGEFIIKAKTGDLLGFSGSGYLADTVYLINLKYKEVYLALPQNMLNELKIKPTNVNTSGLTWAPITPFGGKLVRYITDAKGNPIGGLKLNLLGSGSNYKNKRAQQFETDMQNEQEIDRVFNAQNLQAYLPLKEQELSNFILAYRPDVKTFFSKKFNLVVYLNTCYEEFLKLPVQKRRSATYFRLGGQGN